LRRRAPARGGRHRAAAGHAAAAAGRTGVAPRSVAPAAAAGGAGAAQRPRARGDREPARHQPRLGPGDARGAARRSRPRAGRDARAGDGTGPSLLRVRRHDRPGRGLRPDALLDRPRAGRHDTTMMRSLLLLATLLLAAPAHATVHVDDAGRTVDFAAPPRRVITLAPNLTEFVYAVGAGDTMVGTMDTSDFPAAARQVERIGDYQRLDVERILALKPDVIFVWHHGNQGRELAQLEAAGLKLFYLEPKRLDDIPQTLSRVGALLGHRAQGDARAAAWRDDIAALRARYAK